LLVGSVNPDVSAFPVSLPCSSLQMRVPDVLKNVPDPHKAQIEDPASEVDTKSRLIDIVS
jgi:hypothetical protein